MKKIYLFLLLSISLYLNVQAQKSFEGSVYYRHYIEMKDTTKNEWDVVKFYGSESWLSIKNGNYSWRFGNSDLEKEIYVKDQKRLYSKFQKNDTLYWSPSDEKGEEILKMYPIKKAKNKVLGKSCKLLLLKSKFKKTSEVRGRMYYFSKDYPLNPSMFKDLKTNNQDLIFEKIKAIPLRIVVIHKDYRVIYLAHKIKLGVKEAIKIDPKKPLKRI